MNNIHTVLVLALLVSWPAVADETRSAGPTPRQMAHCMMARVKVSPNESYKTAFKACREQFESTSGESSRTDVNAMNNVDAASNPKN
jgi:hypothetical protein